jgi:glycosyltransferase involved in cell wall biosynthesis
MPSQLKKTAPLELDRNPTRVLFLQHASIFERFGGVEYYIDDLVSLAASTFGPDAVRAVVPYQSELLVKRDYRAEYVRRSQSSLIRKLQNRFFGDLYRKASDVVGELKPTFILNSHVSTGPLARLLAWRYRLPVATCVYGIEAWGDLFPQDEWCLRKSERIFSISHCTKKILVDRGFPESQIDVVHPRLEASFESAPIRAARKKGPLRLLTISRLDSSEQYKGHEHVLMALKKLNRDDIHYTIQGDGNDKARLLEMTQKLGLQERVTFQPGVRNRSDFQHAYSQCDVFIMPSRFGRWEGAWRGEGFGIVYVEAAAFGVPSIAYNCGGATDIILDGKTGWLVKPDDIDALAEQILRLANSPSTIASAGDQAKKHVLKTFTGKAILEEMNQAFSKMER